MIYGGERVGLKLCPILKREDLDTRRVDPLQSPIRGKKKFLLLSPFFCSTWLGIFSENGSNILIFLIGNNEASTQKKWRRATLK